MPNTAPRRRGSTGDRWFWFGLAGLIVLAVVGAPTWLILIVLASMTADFLYSLFR